MSHELRTPLNSLLILSKILSENKDGNLNLEQVKYAQTVYSAGCDLLNLINEILDLSKVEAGRMEIEVRDVFIKEICDYLEQTFMPVAQHKRLGFDLECNSRAPLALFTDQNRLQQILKNLLSNAFKFTEKGYIKLSIGLAEKKRAFGMTSLDNGGKVLYFRVQDTGIGIASNKRHLIFEAFQQGDGTINRKYGGTGLGLTISREIAHLLGGLIEVESEEGEGSIFTLYLPERYVPDAAVVRPDVQDDDSDVPPLPEEADFTGKKILIVDDDKRNSYAISRILEPRGMELIYANNGKEGLQKLQENENVDLILMDTMMPEMDGLEATRLIRAMSEYATLPIVFLTAKAMRGDRENSLKAGASGYITKPVNADKLLGHIYHHVNKASTNLSSS
jgi:CheY-like chemotaxis protein